ncbi:uncharacterized protein STEHIDRAFT_60018, partial [Stereum hirsutum FP-91666 SS1]|uniref:uncharacterized protein n=1 Tax=Stereum hirsutum (strain FP-91666) TaxID=721885 RepID=UPI000444A2EC
NVTERRVCQFAAAHGYHRYVARRKSRLSPSAIKWAKRNNEKDWDDVIWTDEMSIELGERPRHLRTTYCSGRKSIMIWACITHGVKGPIIKLDLPPLTKYVKGRRKGGGMGGKEYWRLGS